MTNTKLGRIILLLGVFIFVCAINFNTVLAVPGYSYDLTSSVSSVIGGSIITFMVADDVHSIVYFGTADGKLGYYNETDDSAVDLTPLITGWVGASWMWDGAIDPVNNRLYFTAGQIMNLRGYYSLNDNTATQLTDAWFYYTTLEWDKESNIMWYSGNDGWFGTINTTDDTITPIGTGYAGGICIDYEDDRVYIIANGASQIYYDKTNASIVTLSQIPITIASCTIDPIHHVVYFGRGEMFQSSGYYFPENDSYVTSFWNGDSVTDIVSKYMSGSDTVGVIQTGYVSLIYNRSDNTTLYLRTTEVGTWMDSGDMYAGDYMNTSKRLYMGLTDGSFGYFDNGYACTEQWIAQYGACQVNDTQLLTYYDSNLCGTYDNVPVDNGTWVACEYVCPGENWVGHVTKCAPNDTYVIYYTDSNFCDTYDFLPLDNGTERNCSFYCSELMYNVWNDVNQTKTIVTELNNTVTQINITLGNISNVIAYDVWNYYARNLTWFPVMISAMDVWTYVDRNLTWFPSSGSVFVNSTEISDYVWNYTARYTHGVIV